MTNGIRCGVEEPLQANEQILATDASGSAQLATFSVAGLNRYSFVWTQPSPISFDLLEILLGYEQGYRSVVVGWNHDIAGTYRIRSLRTERALAKAGWVTQAEQGLGLGCKTYGKLKGDIWPPVPTLPFLGWFVMVGGALTPAQMLGGSFVTTIRSFCRRSKLEPSRDFLEGLVSEGVTIVYPARGATDLHGVVVVSPSVLSTPVMGLRVSGVISEVRMNETAASVWL
jgi:hypothetical protein